MTNKPMLSVDLRALLERVVDNRYREKEKISIARHEALWELRALLDKPVCAHEFESPVLSSMPDFCKKCSEDKPAAQPQGIHPLIATLHENGELIAAQATIAQQAKLIESLRTGRQGEPVAEIEREFDNAPAHVHLYQDFPDGTKLYAEQPAPVAFRYRFDADKGSMVASADGEWIPYSRRNAGIAAPVAVACSDKEDMLYDCAYRNGVMFGYGIGINGTEADYQKCVNRLQEQIVEARRELKKAPISDQAQCEECKGWGYHENHHEGGGTECGECGGSGKSPVAVVMPDNLLSHRESWLQAMERLVALEAELEAEAGQSAHDSNDPAYWEHELKAMRAMYADIDRLNVVKP